MKPTILWSTRDWARAIADLPAAAALPRRTAFVGRERVAHALRRELVSSGRGSALVGTLFTSPVKAAAEVLVHAGVDFSPGEGALRATRLLRVFADLESLSYFDPDQLRRASGWEDAFAETIRDLEGAGLTPAGLSRKAGPEKDVAAVWAALERSAGESWSAERILREAASLLERDPSPWPFEGPVFAAVTGHEPAVLARFLRAVPEIFLGLFGARPIRPSFLERVETLFGPEARRALATSARAPSGDSEREILGALLFSPPEELARIRRARSKGPDGTVSLETHAGFDAELEAAADWVARQVLDGVPLEQIAVLSAASDEQAALVAERIARLPWAAGFVPVHLSAGAPPAGAPRALAALQALRAHLPVEALAELASCIRLSKEEDAEDRNHLSRGRAVDLLSRMGTSGGNPERPEGLREWAARLDERTHELEAEIAESAGDERTSKRLQRELRDLRALAPGLRALVGVGEKALARSPVGEVWSAFEAFLADWLLDPSQGARVRDLLGAALEGVCADGACAVTGGLALQVIEDAVASLRAAPIRFGEPAVFVGTVADAEGLSFAAVRVVGLSEGTLPSAHREDPVLPDAQRAGLAGGLVHGARDRVLRQLHQLHRVVAGATKEVAFSAPLVDFGDTQRQPSSVFLEAAAALGRPEWKAQVVPDSNLLERGAFRPARNAAAAARRDSPLSKAAWLDRAARLAEAPASWAATPVLHLDSLDLATPGPMDGLLRCDPVPALPGLSEQTPISASALGVFLRCPHQFLFERVFGWQEPSAVPSQRRIDVLEYGSLLHFAAERFFRDNGAAFVRHARALPQWMRVGDQVCKEVFEELMRTYPLAGEAIRAQELRRLQTDLRNFLDYDWEQSKGAKVREFVDVERGFQHELKKEGLFVAGQLDRIDSEGDVTLVRDLKTGSAHLRQGAEAGPTPVRDVQIALYGLVAREMAGEWGTPDDVAAAYAYVTARDERAFREDFDELERAARGWLSTVRDMLEERLFPRSPEPDDCDYCPFAPVCGEGRSERAEQVLANAKGSLGAFLKLKRPEEQP